MSLIEKLKAKIEATKTERLPEVAQPMLDRIENEVAGGIGAVVWCQASWGESCDKVNVSDS